LPADNPFETNTRQYEQWFENNRYVYQSELEAVRSFIPNHGKGVEIGVGSGRFAAPLKITLGIEPASKMRLLAIQRGILAIAGKAEALPFQSEYFDFALMVTTLCFVENIKFVLQEIHRILVPKGKIIIGFVDKDSSLGQIYFQNRDKSVFYKNAVFYSVSEVITLLKKEGFQNMQFLQTIFKPLKQIVKAEPVAPGFGEGSFVVVCGEKAEN